MSQKMEFQAQIFSKNYKNVCMCEIGNGTGSNFIRGVQVLCLNIDFYTFIFT